MPAKRTIRKDDAIDTRDWEGPIPGVTPTTIPRDVALDPTVFQRIRTAAGTARKVIVRELRERPLAVLGAAFGVGAIAGASVRSAPGRALLLAVAGRLAEQVMHERSA